MIVAMWMAKELATIEPKTSLGDASALMSANRVRRLPVVERRRDGQVSLVGIVSQGDILRAYPPDINPFGVLAREGLAAQRQVSSLMSSALITTVPDAAIETAAELMRTHKIGALPVLRARALVGLITESDIFRAFVSLFHHSAEAVRVTFDASGEDDVLALVADLAHGHKLRLLSAFTSQQDGRKICVVHLLGAGVERMIEDIWMTGHSVLSVLRR